MLLVGGEETCRQVHLGASKHSRLRFQMAPEDAATGNFSQGAHLLNPNIDRFIGADNYVGAAANGRHAGGHADPEPGLLTSPQTMDCDVLLGADSL
jgi:hypothetical protein